MTKAEKVWTTSHNQLAAQVSDTATIVTFDDGSQGILPGTCPTGLANAFARSTQHGYAMGWL